MRRRPTERRLPTVEVRALRPLLAVGLALGALLAADGARAQPAPELTLRAQPASLLLGSDASATLTLEAPPGAPRPSVTTNLGELGPLEEAGPGRWTLRYTPPSKRFPQVALVAAVAGPLQGWVAIPLVGQGEALVRARPHQRIDAVQIGERSFGPFVADAKGNALVPVQVPPGVTHAYHAGKAIDLGLPTTPHLHLALDRAALPADQTASAQILVYTVTPSGDPREGASVELRPSAGTVSALSAVAPGVLRGTWTLPPGPVGNVTLTGVLRDEPGQLRTMSLLRPPGRPVHFTLESDRPQLVAGEPPLLVRATARDAAGRPAPAEFALETSLGQAEPPRPTGPGGWESRVSVPGTFGGRSRLVVTATSALGEPLATLEVPLIPGPQQLLLAPPEAQVAADGRSGVELRVEARDSFGNPSQDSPRVRAGRGEARVFPVEPGQWRVDYRAPATVGQGRDEVLVELGTLSARGRIELLSGFARLEVSPKLGLLGNEVVGGAWLGLEAGYRFELLGERFAVLAEGSWYRLSRDEVAEGTPTLHGRHDFLSVLANVAWRKPVGVSGRWVVSIGGGLGFTQSWSALTVEGQPAQEDQGLAFSYQATFGVQRRAPLGGPFLEVRYWRNGNLGTPNVRGQVGSVLLDLGYRFEAF